MKTFLFLTAMLLSCVVYGQTKFLRNYNFDEGGYTLLGIYSKNGPPHGIGDSLGDFYTDDVAVLNQFKNNWVFKKNFSISKCGYDYEIYICKNGITLEKFVLNTACNEIISKKGSFSFNIAEFRQLTPDLKKPVLLLSKLNSLEEARDYIIKIQTDTNVIRTETPEWLHYEGEFSFIYKTEKHFKKSADIEKDLYYEISNEISQNYPNESFELHYYGGPVLKNEGRNKYSASGTQFYIKSNKTLADKFNLYPFGWNRWKSYKPELVIYLKKEKE